MMQKGAPICTANYSYTVRFAPSQRLHAVSAAHALKLCILRTVYDCGTADVSRRTPCENSFRWSRRRVMAPLLAFWPPNFSWRSARSLMTALGASTVSTRVIHRPSSRVLSPKSTRHMEIVSAVTSMAKGREGAAKEREQKKSKTLRKDYSCSEQWTVIRIQTMQSFNCNQSVVLVVGHPVWLRLARALLWYHVGDEQEDEQ
ncbi:hypothetical protein VTO42DRAFT_8990 [Malbranchea cinnamomea]